MILVGETQSFAVKAGESLKFGGEAAGGNSGLAGSGVKIKGATLATGCRGEVEVEHGEGFVGEMEEAAKG
jgi:hypothetical protein